MKSIKRRFNEEIKSIAAEHGFQKIKVPYMGEIYGRATEEMWQVFEFVSYSSHTCDVDISVFPIRGEINEYSFMGAEEPIMLTALSGLDFDGFSYVMNNEETIISCVKKVVKIFNEIAIPFFSKTTTNYDALHKLLNLECRRFELDILCRMNKFYMALNTKNTFVALDCCYFWIENNKNYLMEDYISSASKKRSNEIIEMLEKYIERLEADDYEFFDSILDKFEERSKEMICEVLKTANLKCLAEWEKGDIFLSPRWDNARFCLTR